MAKAQLHVWKGSEMNPDQWNDFVKGSPQGSFYAQHAYLSMLRVDWQAFVVEEGGDWKAAMPFVINKRWKYSSLPQLPFTQYLGVMFGDLGEISIYRRYSSYQRWLELMVGEWEGIDLFVQNFSPAFDYGLAFHWGGFELRNRFTYYLDLSKGEDKIRQGFSKGLQRNLRKAETLGMSFRIAQDSRNLLEILNKNKAEGRDLMGGHQASWERIGEVSAYFCSHEGADLVEVVDEKGKVQAANMLGFWGQKVYSLMGITSPEARKLGGMAFLMWNCILYAKSKGYSVFDFEGSMIPGVARFFQDFGAQPISYLQISRNRLPKLLQWIQKSRT